jgi:hypothetical protein
VKFHGARSGGTAVDGQVADRGRARVVI